MIFPVLFVFGFQYANHTDKGLVKSLTLAISLRVIWCCLHLSNIGQFAQFFDQLPLKVTALVCRQFFRKTIIYDKFIPESSCCCLCSLGGSYDSLCISHKVVHYDQNVHVNTCTGIFYCQKVHMDQLQSSR